ncbi:hypothetical protein KG892_01465 [Vermiphilus pyriformis]|uniref:Uncharacterized protein n=1 Tax=candidate division TM6 bacterium JCVI TM6SC1 TaxID=1306947 RepID=A0A0D2JF20_9BACT|nr:hypothetical protein J120_01680 [candidate division TM6 bacterium JCVI TM6SC1]UNE35673.1 MAG: hypothetical protein KG892_01465 [Vermiphilus pyriformis]
MKLYIMISILLTTSINVSAYIITFINDTNKNVSARIQTLWGNPLYKDIPAHETATVDTGGWCPEIIRINGNDDSGKPLQRSYKLDATKNLCRDRTVHIKSKFYNPLEIEISK